MRRFREKGRRRRVGFFGMKKTRSGRFWYCMYVGGLGVFGMIADWADGNGNQIEENGLLEFGSVSRIGLTHFLSF